MNITKDEARIFAVLIKEGMHELVSDCFVEKQTKIEAINSLESLIKKLQAFGYDKRRCGRTSHDDFNDCLKRYIKNQKKG